VVSAAPGELPAKLLMQFQSRDGTLNFQLVSFSIADPDNAADAPIFSWRETEVLEPLPEKPPIVETPDQVITSGIKYTAAELQVMVNEAAIAARDLELQYKKAMLEYQQAEKELSNGSIYSQISGKVSGVIAPEEAKNYGQPVLAVTAGGGYFIEGVISEFQLNKLQIGQEIVVYSWQTGTECTGTIREISEFPASGGYYYGGGNNNNISLYPFTVFVDESAGLMQGEYVSLRLSNAVSESGFYLENMFLRKENGRSYVYLRGEDGRLEKRYVTTGKSVWGSYTQVYDGVTMEDFVAFPYGDAVVDGAPTQESNASEFYGW